MVENHTKQLEEPLINVQNFYLGSLGSIYCIWWILIPRPVAK